MEPSVMSILVPNTKAAFNVRLKNFFTSLMLIPAAILFYVHALNRWPTCLANPAIFEACGPNVFGVFTSPTPKTTHKAQEKLSSLKRDCSLFSRLFISCQTREGNLDNFFEHENQGCPPSLSKLGKLLLPSKKSELAECLQSFTTPQSKMPDDVDAIIVDGAVVVNMIKPRSQRTFADYSTQSFLPYVQSQLRHVKRVDIVWDEYFETSLKATTRDKRGLGSRRRVQPNNPLPRNWQQFLRNDENKRELFRFLAECASVLGGEKQVITTYGSEVLCTPPRDDTSTLSPCTQEEADTRMILHAADAIQQGYRKVVLRTVDTDVLVLATAFAGQLQDKLAQVWLALGTGVHLRYIAARDISRSLGSDMSKCLPFFHAFTGCDTVSSFAGKGKKTAFTTWKSCPAVTESFLELTERPTQISDECLARLERFVVVMYDRTSTKTSVNEARKQLFTQQGRAFNAIPPSRAALLQHAKRATYQAGYCWSQALTPSPDLPCPDKWGWVFKEGWQPFWTTLPDITASCRELVRCRCKKGCRANCSCVKAALKCSALCSCSDNCNN
ncbi:hypothetical protein QZH41_014263 [Actinostola sp. cb2023]|nr:hypothetical protein QZH41_014263 [Actinostola sp. cb2023]